MTGAERLRTALSHKEGDRVPLDLWVKDEVLERLVGDLSLPDKEAFLRAFDIDFRYVSGPSGRTKGGGGETQDGVVRDHWGVVRKVVDVSQPGYAYSYKHLDCPPLAGFNTAGEIEQYKDWPLSDAWNFKGLKDQFEAFSPHAVVNAGDRLDRTAQLKTLMYLRGVEQCLVDLAINGQLVERILEKIRQYYLSYNERVFQEAGDSIDLFMMGDDFGDQNGSLIGLDMWRKYFKQGFKQYIELAHRYGIPVMHHTCGSVRELIPDMIDCGLDVLQSLQPRAKGMDLGELKAEFGRDLCFHGGIDIQAVLPMGSTMDVKRHVRRTLDAGKPGGGFIVCTAHAIQPDVPTENVLALLEAYEAFSKY